MRIKWCRHFLGVPWKNIKSRRDEYFSNWDFFGLNFLLWFLEKKIVNYFCVTSTFCNDEILLTRVIHTHTYTLLYRNEKAIEYIRFDCWPNFNQLIKFHYQWITSEILKKEVKRLPLCLIFYRYKAQCKVHIYAKTTKKIMSRAYFSPHRCLYLNWIGYVTYFVQTNAPKLIKMSMFHS